ncbi:hypothetical protein EVAR_69611_1 [Eumeta japonica]|uniref:Uncharacterized protein n=1 Tax=Eumeta variegata TaxID=151549 RepID=A0A4C2AAP1_EUMVA|nr:hypothetical protein EVAR_69611_1 [Eumeta japonica]
MKQPGQGRAPHDAVIRSVRGAPMTPPAPAFVLGTWSTSTRNPPKLRHRNSLNKQHKTDYAKRNDLMSRAVVNLATARRWADSADVPTLAMMAMLLFTVAHSPVHHPTFQSIPFHLIVFSLRGEGIENLMSCHAPACVGCVRPGVTKKPPKQHIGWLSSVATINWSFEDFVCRGRSAWDAIGARLPYGCRKTSDMSLLIFINLSTPAVSSSVAFKAKAAWFESAVGLRNFENKYRLRACLDDDDARSIEPSLWKHTRHYRRLWMIPNLSMRRCGKKWEHTAEPGSSSTSSADTGGLILHLPTLKLTHFRGRGQDWLSFIDIFDSLIDSRTDLTASPKIAYLLSCLRVEPRAFDRLVEFLEKERELLTNILLDASEPNDNPGRWMTPDQRAGSSARRSETSSLLLRKSNSMPHPIYAAGAESKTMCMMIVDQRVCEMGSRPHAGGSTTFIPISGMRYTCLSTHFTRVCAIGCDPESSVTALRTTSSFALTYLRTVGQERRRALLGSTAGRRTSRAGSRQHPARRSSPRSGNVETAHPRAFRLVKGRTFYMFHFVLAKIADLIKVVKATLMLAQKPLRRSKMKTSFVLLCLLSVACCAFIADRPRSHQLSRPITTGHGEAGLENLTRSSTCSGRGREASARALAHRLSQLHRRTYPYSSYNTAPSRVIYRPTKQMKEAHYRPKVIKSGVVSAARGAPSCARTPSPAPRARPCAGAGYAPGGAAARSPPMTDRRSVWEMNSPTPRSAVDDLTIDWLV